jgi:hypothetical protein
MQFLKNVTKPGSIFATSSLVSSFFSVHNLQPAGHLTEVEQQRKPRGDEEEEEEEEEEEDANESNRSRGEHAKGIGGKRNSDERFCEGCIKLKDALEEIEELKGKVHEPAMRDFEELRSECDALRAEHEEVLARVEAADLLEGEIVRVRAESMRVEEELYRIKGSRRLGNAGYAGVSRSSVRGWGGVGLIVDKDDVGEVVRVVGFVPGGHALSSGDVRLGDE